LGEKRNTEILLVALNARYRHTSFGLRCLQANLGRLESRSELMEFTINQRPVDMLEKIVATAPKIIGLGVYIWNVALVEELLGLVRVVLPDTVVVIGGPEVSYEWEGQRLQSLVHFVVQGEGEHAFRDLCEAILAESTPTGQVIAGATPELAELAFPYRLYTDEDILNRVVYVEASRGCPYKCQFCLSSLDKRVRDAPMDAFLGELDILLDRGAQDFKFIDRTFNLSLRFSLTILSFFQERYRPGLSLHFEMVPERLPEELLVALAAFPPGVVQLEVGVQTFSPDVSKRISRPMKIEKVCTNLLALHDRTQVHMHVDLIVGLPGEDTASFGRGFDRLQALGPHEIQVGILKRLKGTPIRQYTSVFELVYSPNPPFEVMQTQDIDFATMNELKRFARFWDLVVNKGQFPASSALIWRGRESGFEAFREFTIWVYGTLGRTSPISLLKLADCILDYLVQERGFLEADAGPVLAADLVRMPGRRLPKRLQVYDAAKGRGGEKGEGAKGETQTKLARQRRRLG
jgi:radical SAM superfamily enzyme YgiQ (UPF0313 family)